MGRPPYAARWTEYPDAIIGGARFVLGAALPGAGLRTCRWKVRTFHGGQPRRVAVRLVVLHGRSPATLDFRWDESYGGEDALFSADAQAREVAAGLRSTHRRGP